MLINTFLDTEDFVHLYYPEDEPPPAATQGCGAGARLACKYTARPPSPDYSQVSCNMSERDRVRAPPPPEPPPHRVRAAELYPRKRTHYDEPDLDVPFVTICGEFVQWVARTADSGTLAMSNYRFHTQPRRRSGPGTSVPLRVIDNVEIRDLVHLHIFCKDGRTLKCTFSGGEQCAEWWRRLTNALPPLTGVQDTFAAAYSAWAREQPPASIHRALMRASHGPNRHWFGPELERLGFTSKGAWRVTTVNSDYKLCSSYPPLLVVPACIGDEDLDSVARFRAMRRVPAVVWRHRGNGAVIARASQPEVGWLGWRSSEDERLLAAFVTACSQDRGLQPPNTARQIKLLIIDARSYASAVTNRARGGGCECPQYYPAADIQFMCLANIHNVRKSFQQLRQLVAEPAEQTNWHSGLERTLWLQYLSGLGRAAALAARAVLAGRPVLVHCSDGWDRTPQIVSAAQLILDPYYRTIQGFRVLIEREWLDFGHKFADRCGHQFSLEEPNEKSPIFLQWLDLVHQIMIQYPCSFEFSEAYLIKLITHVYSCMFGTFLCNGPKERSEHRIVETTAQVWKLLEGPAYRNHLYCAPSGEQVLWPEYNVRSLHLWSALFMGVRVDSEDDCEVEETPLTPPTAPTIPHAPLMTKTRSCDDLLNEGERRTTQRRCSDPNLVNDVMKLSTMLSGSESCSSMSRGEVRGVTDSYVDGMASPSPPATIAAAPSVILETSTDEVDGINPNHFENGTQCLPRNIASNSSSLERELVDTQMIRSDHTLVDGANSAEPASPEDQTIFIEDTYSDVLNMTEALNFDVQPAPGRMRHISITWRSVSESSHQTDSSAGFDLTEVAPRNRMDSNNQSTSSITNNGSTEHESSPLDNHNSTAGDEANHNITMNGSGTLTNHNRMETSRSSVPNGDVPNGKEIDEDTRKLLADELVITDSRACSSGASSESEAEGSGDKSVCRRRCVLRAGARARATSQHTLCPSSPRTCIHCSQNGVSKCGDQDTRLVTESVSCMCGGTPGYNHTRDPLDGLPPAHVPLQARLHNIILNQKIALEQLTSELRVTRDALYQRLSPAPITRYPMPGIVGRSAPGTLGASGVSGVSSVSSSSSTSGSEVEVGEEARSAVWLPDSAAPRCQYCRNHFWLARRRHHCRKCGGIFCSSCSEVGALEEWPSVRVCRLCRTHR